MLCIKIILSNIKFYLNGVQDASTTVSKHLRLVLVLSIHNKEPKIIQTDFNIADVRIVKASEFIHRAFTPPIETTTKDCKHTINTNVNTSITASNTKLLLNFPTKT